MHTKRGWEIPHAYMHTYIPNPIRLRVKAYLSIVNPIRLRVEAYLSIRSESNYEGPYVVKQAFSRGALVLVDSEGQELMHLVNADAVKMFYHMEFDQERIQRINL
ncbi:hypothetical protein CR513_05662, partial [Mucuna pruriens]